jgi:Extracellular link domain
MDYNRNRLGMNRVGMRNMASSTQTLIGTVSQALLYVIFLLIVLYVIYYTYLYVTTDCPNKIGYFRYLVNFGVTGMCEGEDRGISMEEEMSHKQVAVATAEATTGTSAKSGLSDEVFQISNQMYSYDEAKCKCEAYGGRLATKAELTDAYNRGAHWCNYGWIDGGEAYYPVQQCELDRKAKLIREYNEILKNHHEDPIKYTWRMVNEARNRMDREGALDYCGDSAGLHGGKFNNLRTRFGATCFGAKPAGMAVREKEAKCAMSEAEKKSLEQAEREKAARKVCNGQSANDKIVAFNPDRW